MEWHGSRFRAQIVQFCAFSALRATGLARRLLATRYLLGMRTGSFRKVSHRWQLGTRGVDPRADAPGAAPPGGLPEAGVPALARLSGGHGDLGQAICRNGGRRRAEKNGRALPPAHGMQPWALPLAGGMFRRVSMRGIRSGLQEGRTNDDPPPREFSGVACLNRSPYRPRARRC